MKIPKIIHYCWFGPKPIPDLEKSCIKTWKKYFPDYELKFWNEDTFDINASKFTREAFNKKYYAFVSDFARAVILRKYGGIYLDTDIEILSNFENLLYDHDAVLGFENRTFVGTALMAFIPNHPIIIELENYYKNLSFISQNGNIEIQANPSILADILIKHNIKMNGAEQEVEGLKIYKRNVFFPKKISENVFEITQDSLAIHHFSGSWLTPRQKCRGQNKIWIEVCRPILRKCKNILLKILGNKRTKTIENNIRNWLK